MNDVSWMLNLKVKDLDALEPLMTEMVANVRDNEPNTMNYEWFLNGDKTECHLYERYTDSGAALIHLGTFMEKFAERFMAVFDAERVVLYGPASDELRSAMANFGAVEMAHIGGVKR